SRSRRSFNGPGGSAPARPGGLPESMVSAARPPIELVLDVPGGQTYPRDSVLALGGEEHQLVHAAAGELSVCCKAAHRAGARRSRGPDVPERLGARPERDEHQLVHPYAIWRA